MTAPMLPLRHASPLELHTESNLRGVCRMKKSEDYLKHAKACRGLAKQMESGEQRDQLLKMAETWEVLAAERSRTLRNRGEEGAPLSPKEKPNA